MIKAIETYYNGRYFRSRLEARWAVFFDACGVKYEYEPEGYELDNGLWYLPDFLLHGVTFNHAAFAKDKDLYVEVKGNMDKESAEKVKAFSKDKPVLVVGEVPLGEEIYGLCDSMQDAPTRYDVPLYNFELIDGDWFQAYPGIDLDGDFELFGGDSTYLDAMDKKATVRAYRKARMARFDRGDQIIQEMKNSN